MKIAVRTVPGFARSKIIDVIEVPVEVSISKGRLKVSNIRPLVYDHKGDAMTVEFGLYSDDGTFIPMPIQTQCGNSPKFAAMRGSPLTIENIDLHTDFMGEIKPDKIGELSLR